MARSHDLTRGAIPGHFRKLAVPAAIGLLFSTLYNVVDVYFAGMLGTQAQAGMTIAFQAFFVLVAVGIGLGSAMAALIGSAVGQKDLAQARGIAAQGLSYGIIATCVMVALEFFLGPRLLVLISAPGGYRHAAIAYLMFLLTAAPGFILAFGANGVLQANGDTVSMQYAMGAAFLVNIGLDPLLMFGIPGLVHGIGFNGIAIATALSQTGVMAYVLWRVSRLQLAHGLRLTDFRPDLTAFGRITGQLVPTSFAMLVMLLAGFVVQFYLKSFGESAVAAYGISLRIEQLFLLPVFGLTGALLPIAAQNYGAGHHARVRQALFDCWKFGWLFMCVACPLLWLAAGFALRLFTHDSAVIAIGVSYLHIDGLILPFYMMLFAVNALLQALQKPIWTLWIGIYRQAFAVTFFAWLYAHWLGFGVIGVWFGIGTSVLTGFLLAVAVAQKVSRPLIGGLWRIKPQRLEAAD